jgi:hypothetical protein
MVLTVSYELQSYELRVGRTRARLSYMVLTVSYELQSYELRVGRTRARLSYMVLTVSCELQSYELDPCGFPMGIITHNYKDFNGV